MKLSVEAVAPVPRTWPSPLAVPFKPTVRMEFCARILIMAIEASSARKVVAS